VKNFFNGFAFIVLPILATVALTLVVRLTMPTPKGVTSIVETGEVWYNPTSWALNESAEHATMQANKAMAAAVSYTQGMTLAASAAAGVVLTLLVLAIRKGWVDKTEVKTKAFIEQAPAATHTPAQKGPNVSEPITSRSTSSEDRRDSALTGQAMATATA